MRYRYRALAFVAAISIVATASGCASQTNSAAHATTASTGVGQCVPFPADQLPPNPAPGTPPAFGDPSLPSSLAATQAAVIAKARTLSSNGYYCAEGRANVLSDECNQGYWGFTYTNDPGTQRDCNFFYSRVDDSYWSQLTPILLSEYYDYLSLITDGRDLVNQSVGPHTTIAQPGNMSISFGGTGMPYGTVSLVNGALDAGQVGALLTKSTTDPAGTTPTSGGKPTGVIPMFAGAGSSVDCSNVWIIPSGSSKPPTATVPIASVPVTAGSSFFCGIKTGGSQGTAYAAVSLGTPTAGTVPLSIVTQEPGGTASLLRKPGTASAFTPDNVVWPVAIPEVTENQSAALPVPQSCTLSGPGTPESQNNCVHIWLTKVSQNKTTKTYTGCRIFVVLEVDKTPLVATAAKYRLPTDSFTAHISLAKNQYALTGSQAATTCQRAADLNVAAGKPALGNPPANTSNLT